VLPCAEGPHAGPFVGPPFSPRRLFRFGIRQKVVLVLLTALSVSG
jgi:hypothetical protein